MISTRNTPVEASDAMMPVPGRAFGKDLRPLSLGHAVLLEQIESPLLGSDLEAIDASACCSCVHLLTMDWREARAAVLRKPGPVTSLWAVGAMLRCAFREFWFLREYGKLAAHIARCCSAPALFTRSGDGPSKRMPPFLHMRALAQSRLGMDRGDAMDSTPGELLWMLGVLIGGTDPDAWMDEDDFELIDRGERIRQEILDGHTF